MVAIPRHDTARRDETTMAEQGHRVEHYEFLDDTAQVRGAPFRAVLEKGKERSR